MESQEDSHNALKIWKKTVYYLYENWEHTISTSWFYESTSIMATYSDIKDNAKHIVICRGLVVVISWYGQQQKICAKLTFNTPSSGAAPHFLWGNSSQNHTIIVVETRKSSSAPAPFVHKYIYLLNKNDNDYKNGRIFIRTCPVSFNSQSHILTQRLYY